MGRLFGTDGVRGVANSFLTCELATAIGRAAAFSISGKRRGGRVFCVGWDTRASSEMLAAAIAAGICSCGVDVIMLGVVPTPAVAYLVSKYKCDAGVMISASHNSSEFNGIKIFNGDGYKIPDALEEQIEDIVLGGEIKIALSSEVGRIEYAEKAVDDYCEHIKKSVLHSLDGLKIALDCANGSASVTAKMLFSSLGAEVEVISDSPDGKNINFECGSTDINRLCKIVKNGDFAGGAAFDGDADRCICVDENGDVIDGDDIMAICALDMKKRGKLFKNTVVGTVMTNFGFSKFCEENDLGFVSTKVGDRFVLEEMLLGEYNLGGEQSGHIIFRDFSTTGDGQMTAAQLFSLAARNGKRLSELASVMKKYPQVMRNVKVNEKGKLNFYTDDTVREAIEKAKSELGNRGRVVVRVSGTEPLIRIMTEGDNNEETECIANELEKTLLSCLAAENNGE